MQIRLYCDEDAQRASIVQGLRLRGVDVLTAYEAGTIKWKDADQLAYATAQGRALYSFNIGDYLALHSAWLSEGKSHAGIILAPNQRYNVGEQLRRLLRLISAKSAEAMRGNVEFLSAWG